MKGSFKPASVTFPEDLLTDIDQRAGELDMTRSQYLRSLARTDLAKSKGKEAEPEAAAHGADHHHHHAKAA